MAAGLFWVLLTGTYTIPEFTNFHNYQLDPEKLPIVPTLFITIACGAISGFHATQSSLMARCINSEKESRAVFYGSMISESVIALIWAAIAMAFFGGASQLGENLAEHQGNAAWVVDIVSKTTLGKVGAILALLGVVVAPITSGDTAFRGARLIVADMLKIDQRPIVKRFAVCIPLFVIGYGITQINFDIVWRYFAWANQTLAALVLWTIFIWLRKERKNYIVALLPALFMTFIVITFVFNSGQFLGISSRPLCYCIAGVLTIAAWWLFNRKAVSQIKDNEIHS